MDAALLVAKLHGDLLRLIAERENFHFDGLRSAASHLRRKRNVDSKVCKKLAAVDEAFNLNRHITCVSARTFFQVVVDQLSNDPHNVISDEPSSLASTSLPNFGDSEIPTPGNGLAHSPEFFCLYDSDDVASLGVSPLGGVSASPPLLVDVTIQTAHADNGVLVLSDPPDLVLTAHAQACALLRGDLLAASLRISGCLAALDDSVVHTAGPSTLFGRGTFDEHARMCLVLIPTIGYNQGLGDPDFDVFMDPDSKVGDFSRGIHRWHDVLDSIKTHFYLTLWDFDRELLALQDFHGIFVSPRHLFEASLGSDDGGSCGMLPAASSAPSSPRMRSWFVGRDGAVTVLRSAHSCWYAMLVVSPRA
mmetsp:Transcript_68996/g.192107  ORF Transcript_68996/g.192107 Transcript_68996/m.192107 type:complete len:362 (-) Transcript_68996:8-1093(-)